MHFVRDIHENISLNRPGTGPRHRVYVPFATAKIGAGAPPLKTDKGWLLIFHAVDEDPARTVIMKTGNRPWHKRYTAGAALYDLEDPTKLIAITKEPLLVAETPYETGADDLWTEFTIFPCGAVLEDDNNTLRIYYGAGDHKWVPWVEHC